MGTRAKKGNGELGERANPSLSPPGKLAAGYLVCVSVNLQCHVVFEVPYLTSYFKSFYSLEEIWKYIAIFDPFAN